MHRSYERMGKAAAGMRSQTLGCSLFHLNRRSKECIPLFLTTWSRKDYSIGPVIVSLARIPIAENECVAYIGCPICGGLEEASDATDIDEQPVQMAKFVHDGRDGSNITFVHRRKRQAKNPLRPRTPRTSGSQYFWRTPLSTWPEEEAQRVLCEDKAGRRPRKEGSQPVQNCEL